MKRIWLVIYICCLIFSAGALRLHAEETRKVYIIAIDAMRADYLSSRDADGSSLTPNLDAFLKKSVAFANCFDLLPAFTDTNHFAIISSASAGRSGVWGAGGYYAGFDEKGMPILRLYKFADAQAPTLYDSVKQADPKSKTAVISGKHWVAELFAENNPAVDIMAHGRQFPAYAASPKGYWLGGAPGEKTAQNPIRIYLRGENEPAQPGLIGMIGMTAPDSPSDDWVTDTAIAVIQKEDPAFAYILYADMDTAGHIYGSYNVPADWSGIDDQDAMRAQMRTTDAAVGRFLNFLDQTGRLKNGIVVITADHGMTSTRESFQFVPGQNINSSLTTLMSMFQQGKVGAFAVDIKKILADNGLLDRMAVKDGKQPDYDYIFSEATSVYLYGVKPDKAAQIVQILNDWNRAKPDSPIWLVLTQEDMKNGTNEKTGIKYSLYNEKNAKNKCPKAGPCAPGDGTDAGTGVPWPDIAVFMNEGYINVVYPEEITQGVFAVMKSATLNKLSIKLPPIPVVPGSHGSWSEQHVPLIISAPNLPGGTVVDRNVSLLDIFPTISHFIPAWKLPEGVEGKSLF